MASGNAWVTCSCLSSEELLVKTDWNLYKSEKILATEELEHTTQTADTMGTFGIGLSTPGVVLNKAWNGGIEATKAFKILPASVIVLLDARG